MRGALLDQDFYDRLIGVEDIPHIIELLKETAYQEDIEHSTIDDNSATAIEDGLKRNISRNFRKVQTFVGKRASELLAILLARWDLHNIKTVLRGKHMKISDEEIVASFVPAGDLDELLLLELVKQTSVTGCVDLLAIWGVNYAKPLTAQMPEYFRDKNLMVLETALDRFYYADALKKVRKRSLNVGLVKAVLVSTIDITNIITLLRVQDVNFDKTARELVEKRKRAELEEGATEVFKPDHLLVLVYRTFPHQLRHRGYSMPISTLFSSLPTVPFRKAFFLSIQV